MADEVISDPNDPRLNINTPGQPGYTGKPWEDFQKKEAPTQAEISKPWEDFKLPERKASRQTFYYPATPQATAAAGLSYGMEGGIHGAGKFSDVDLREHTVEKFQQGKTDWVAVAMQGVPTGEKFQTKTEDGKPIVGRWVDTGGGLRPGQQDIATEDPQKAKTGGTGGPWEDFQQRTGPSAAMQIAMEQPPAKPAPSETPQAAASGGGAGGGGFTPTPAPEFAPLPQVKLPQIPMGSGMTPTPPIPTAAPTPWVDFQQPSPFRNAAEAAYEVGSSFIPKSLEDVNSFFEPAIAAPAQIRQGYDAVKSFIGGASMDEIAQQIPQSQILKEADKTPAYSKERFKAGFETVAQMGMAAGVGKGAFPRAAKEIPGAFAGKPPPGGRQVAVAKPSAAEPVAPAKITGAAIKNEATGKVYTGPSHPQIYEKLPESAFKGVAEEQPDYFTGEGWNSPEGLSDGFVDENGKFYYRDEALQQAVKAKQYKAHGTYDDRLELNELQRQEAETAAKAKPAAAETAPPKATQPEAATPATKVAGTKAAVLPEPVSADELRLTSTKNAQVDKERVARGQQPIVQKAFESDPEVWAQSERAFAQDQNVGKSLVAAINSGQKVSISPLDEAILLREKIDVQNARSIVAQVAEDGRMPDEQRNYARDQFDILEAHMTEIDKATYRQGQLWGRYGQFRQRMAAEDYSLLNVERRFRNARNGKPLTTDEHTKLEKLADPVAKVNEKLEKKLREQQRESLPGKRNVRDPELRKLQHSLYKAQLAVDDAVFKEILKNRSMGKRIMDVPYQTWSVLRNWKTSMDLSAFRRQGGIMTMAHPIRAIKSFGPALRALKSDEGYFHVMQDIRDRPNSHEYKQFKLGLTDVHAHKLSDMEELIRSRWAEKVPLINHSNRAYVAMLNTMRADWYDVMRNGLVGDGPINAAQGKAIANFVNVMTGRGGLGKAEAAANVLADVFFAPRYRFSRFQALMGQPLWNAKGARGIIAKEYARALIGYGVTFAIANQVQQWITGQGLNLNPLSTDWMKLTVGNTRIDLLSGLAQSTVVGAREVTGKTTTQGGRTVPIVGQLPYGKQNALDVAVRYLRSGLAPLPSLLVDARLGTDFVGQPVTVGSLAAQTLTPMTVRDVIDVLKEQGVPTGTALAMVAVLGDSVNTYSPVIRRQGDGSMLLRPPSPPRMPRQSAVPGLPRPQVPMRY